MKTEMAYDMQGKPHPVVEFRNDYGGQKFAFWIFMLTELMMFGILFLLFGIYFYRHAEIFAAASGNLNVWLGGANTVILLVSTYTMGVATLLMHQGKLRASALLVGATAVMAVAFLGIIGLEWSINIRHDIYLGSDVLDAMKKGEILFFGLYFVMSGLQGLHVIAGIILMFWVLLLIRSRSIRPEHTLIMKHMTLYWNFVHLVWILLFPLFYMIGV